MAKSLTAQEPPPHPILIAVYGAIAPSEGLSAPQIAIMWMGLGV